MDRKDIKVIVKDGNETRVDGEPIDLGKLVQQHIMPLYVSRDVEIRVARSDALEAAINHAEARDHLYVMVELTNPSKKTWFVHVEKYGKYFSRGRFVRGNDPTLYARYHVFTASFYANRK